MQTYGSTYYQCMWFVCTNMCWTDKTKTVSANIALYIHVYRISNLEITWLFDKFLVEQKTGKIMEQLIAEDIRINVLLTRFFWWHSSFTRYSSSWSFLESCGTVHIHASMKRNGNQLFKRSLPWSCWCLLLTLHFVELAFRYSLV